MTLCYCSNSCHQNNLCLFLVLAILSSLTFVFSDSTDQSQSHCTKSDQECMSGGRKLANTVMRAIRVAQFGASDQLKLQTDVPVPKPQAKEVLFRVKAAGINPVDTYIRTGTYAVKPPLPYTPGSDAAGVVEDVGSDVKNFKKGDRVFTLRTTTGAYAELTVADEKFMGHLANTITFEQGACLGVPYYTAYRALILRANARPGETILVHGASGAVGSASVQIAKARGMRVLGTAGSADGMEWVKKNGADAVFNHRQEGYTQQIMDATGGEGPDVILEMLANVNLEKDLGMIKMRGRIVNIGSRGTVEINPRATMGKECTVTGTLLMSSSDADWHEMHAAIVAGVKKGWLQPHVGKEFPLEKASEAHDLIISTTSAQGNIILKV